MQGVRQSSQSMSVNKTHHNRSPIFEGGATTQNYLSLLTMCRREGPCFTALWWGSQCWGCYRVHLSSSRRPKPIPPSASGTPETWAARGPSPERGSEDAVGVLQALLAWGPPGWPAPHVEMGGFLEPTTLTGGPSPEVAQRCAAPEPWSLPPSLRPSRGRRAAAGAPKASRG